MPDETWANFTFLVFAPVWIGLAAWNWHRDRVETASAKKAHAVRNAALAAAVFVAFAFIAFKGNWRVLWIVFPVALICWLNLRNTYFCTKCNRTAYNHRWLSAMTFCPQCGGKLDPALTEGRPFGLRNGFIDVCSVRSRSRGDVASVPHNETA